MKKIIVVILGFLVGSILPIATSSREVILYAVLVGALAIIMCCCSRHDGIRFFAIFIAGTMMGCSAAALNAEWYESAKVISLWLLVLLAITATAILGVRSQNEKGHVPKHKALPQDKEEEKKE